MKKIIEYIANYLDVEIKDIKLDSEIRELVEDSLEHIEMIMSVEDNFNIQISESEVDKIITFQHLVDFILEKTNEQTESQLER
jgi:acyl carrier protein